VINIYYSQKKNILISKFSGLIDTVDARTCENIFHDFFYYANFPTIITFFTPTAKIKNLKFIYRSSLGSKKYYNLCSNIYFVGITGSQKIFIKIFISLATFSDKFILKNGILDLEKELSISLELPNSEFEELTFNKRIE
jgi:hypothetical protein